MQQKELINKIGEIIKEINGQYTQLQKGDGKLNDFELEFFVSNAQYLTQNAELLRKLNAHFQATEPAPAAAKKEKFFEPVVQQPESVSDDKEKLAATRASAEDAPAANIDIAAEAPADSYSFIREEPEVIRHELEVDESWIDDEEEEPVIAEEPEEEIIAQEPIKAEAKPVKPVAEKQPAAKDDDEVLTINQKMSAQMAGKAATEPTPVTDLKSAITLNDKLLYIKELFNGYSLAYSEAIEILNRFNTFEEARQFLSTNYVSKNDWAEKPATTEKFYSLLRRRYV